MGNLVIKFDLVIRDGEQGGRVAPAQACDQFIIGEMPAAKYKSHPLAG